MTLPIKHSIATALLIFVIILGGFASAARANMAQDQMDHITESWTDTPEQKGLLPMAIAEAEIAILHARVAANQTGDLGWMQKHTRHVMHALDPETINDGPGYGYGVLRAATGVAKHITIAAQQDDASENVKTRAVHVATSANNTVARVAELKGLITRIMAADSAEVAAPMVVQMEALTHQLLDGFDANGDGEITWETGEGGLSECAKHMAIMRAGEGL
ncbi:hypothetical protein [Profundibacter amoris]|uniref:Uncharacterized protein n=1 Tax=Profundibacter amoris TaxID=2171755 RepID=A0A347UGG5_9RHOB|nr:hypothetical protein [Profundibacter amoris]AXX97943.1 hypothetical protein BAR1_08360 [Profundibacter amoris]